MMWNKRLFLFLFLLPAGICAQVKDAGLWAGFGLSADVSKKWELGISPELRLDENLSRVSSYFTDMGAQYKVNKHVFLQATYRVGGKNDGDFYNLRQRLQTGIVLKAKYNDFNFALTSRWQASIRQAASETDADFITTWRNRFKVTYGGLKKIDLSTSFEFFHLTSAYSKPVWQNWRWIVQAEYNLNKRNAVSAGYLIQRDLTESPQEMDFVILVGYQVKLDFKKDEKKAKEKEIVPVPDK